MDVLSLQVRDNLLYCNRKRVRVLWNCVIVFKREHDLKNRFLLFPFSPPTHLCLYL